MFFYAVYKLPIWKDIDSKSRNIRLIILGAIFYVIAHSFLYSKYVKDITSVENYRKYIYYLIIADLAMVGLLLATSKKDNKRKKKKNNRKNKSKGKFNREMMMNLVGPEKYFHQMKQLTPTHTLRNPANQINQADAEQSPCGTIIAMN